MSKADQNYMALALEVAERATARGEVPVGAVIVQDGKLLVRAGNRVEADNDPTAHAEILAIRAAADMLDAPRLPDCDLYVTLEPCAMCAGALVHARLARVIYGASDPKSGGTAHGARVFSHSQAHHVPEVISGLCEEDCVELLKVFFSKKRLNR